MLKCRFKNQFDFTINTDAKTIQWGNIEGDLKQFIDGSTGEISSIAGVKDYNEYLFSRRLIDGEVSLSKTYSYITPNIYKKDITECNDWDKLNQLFTVLI